jgi:glutamate decarboxylase
MTAITKHLPGLRQRDPLLTPAYSGRFIERPAPKYRLPEQGMEPRGAYYTIADELMLDGNAKQNLATFVTTWMEPEAQQLMHDTMAKNMIDKDEYPSTAMIEERCVHMIADLFHATQEGVGASTIGSSEAVMLAGMALKWRWRKRRQAAGLSADKPNLVMGANVQVVWEKFCRYWEIEPRYVPLAEDRFTINAEETLKLVDENTIGVVAILGTTFTGQFEPIGDVHDALVQLNDKTGWHVPLHIDAASGGFVAPFIHPHLIWDFRLPLVQSINVSGHKYGLVYPGVGWVIWRDKAALPEELIFDVNYLGGSMPTFTLNFSRPGSQVVAQYYNFLRLGFAGYHQIMQALRHIARYLAKGIAALGPFELLSDGNDIPVFAFKLKETKHYSVYDISNHLRERGWQVPAYPMPAPIDHIHVLRVVVREGFSEDLASMLLNDLGKAVEYFAGRPNHVPAEPEEQFSH